MRDTVEAESLKITLHDGRRVVIDSSAVRPDGQTLYPVTAVIAGFVLSPDHCDDDKEQLTQDVCDALEKSTNGILNVLEAVIQKSLIECYIKETHGAPEEREINFKSTQLVCRRMAEDMVREKAYLSKLARWLVLNASSWKAEDERRSVPVTSDMIGSLIGVYAEEAAQAIAELLSPPHKPLPYLEEILGIRDPGHEMRPGLPRDMLVVLSSGHFQGLREALYKNTFRRVDGTPWPTAELTRGGSTGYAQLRPPVVEHDPHLPRDQVQAWAQTMWKQQSELSDIDADALDALCAIYLNQARTPEDGAIADVDEILSMRGLKPKRGGQGRRGGYEPEQREEIIRALSHIQNIWLNIAEVKVYESDPKGGRSKKPVTKTLQSRPFIITDRMGQIRLDGYMDVERFIFRPGKAFASFLFGSGRQTGLLFRKALQYDPYRRKWEKRLTRYVSWHWRAIARTGQFVQVYRVQTLLDAVGEVVNERYPSKTRARLEKALEQLQADGVIAGWQYDRWNEKILEKRGWGQEWVLATIAIEAPDEVKDYYRQLSRDVPPNKALQVISPLAAKHKVSPDGFAEAIKSHRKRTGQSQMQVSEILGIKQGYLSKLERGKALASPKLQKAIDNWLASEAG
ncbi:helix-turn-helix domain-containing protein [Haematospirillum jordaniae]|uniref:helix-turn-helix domain-containing protein n=1 Tax=Haematospirillum jordaniae TaxID=1549855 RepID=UPI001ADE073F|nr:helix-turn-helix transcriptional regulator [Haematospirillum jordaniae]